MNNKFQFSAFEEGFCLTDKVSIDSMLNHLLNKFHSRIMIKNTFDIHKKCTFNLALILNFFNLIYYNSYLVNCRVIFSGLDLSFVEFGVIFTTN